MLCWRRPLASRCAVNVLLSHREKCPEVLNDSGGGDDDERNYKLIFDDRFKTRKKTNRFGVCVSLSAPARVRARSLRMRKKCEYPKKNINNRWMDVQT